MRLFLDTNVVIASVTDEPERGETATHLLNQDHDLYTSLINLMEIRTVLTKKKQVERKQVEEIEGKLVEGVEILIPDATDMMEANKKQSENLLYPLDALILACAEGKDAELVTFDSEILDNGGTRPREVL
jgi:predicted nucleic acid-binding protein